MPFMDTTQLEALLRELEHSDPAEAPDRADALADALETALDEDEMGESAR